MEIQKAPLGKVIYTQPQPAYEFNNELSLMDAGNQPFVMESMF